MKIEWMKSEFQNTRGKKLIFEIRAQNDSENW